MGFSESYDRWVNLVEEALNKYIVEKDVPEKTIYSAMLYSLKAGGKRLRPVLALSVCDLLDGDADEVIAFACALEMIHTYSLIHDDLPAMDNDDFRRGRPTNHRVFGEGVAILAGDALLNFAFEVMLDDTSKYGANTAGKLAAMGIIAKASGPSGMIGGQVVDLESECREISTQTLEYMHSRKTGALIRASVEAAAAICGASGEQFHALSGYSEKIGLAFQIKDDILDVEGEAGVTGKNTGSDSKNKKSTFVTVYGLEKSKLMLKAVTGEAIAYISAFGEKAWFLKELALFIASRKK